MFLLLYKIIPFINFVNHLVHTQFLLVVYHHNLQLIKNFTLSQLNPIIFNLFIITITITITTTIITTTLQFIKLIKILNQHHHYDYYFITKHRILAITKVIKRFFINSKRYLKLKDCQLVNAKFSSYLLIMKFPYYFKLNFVFVVATTVYQGHSTFKVYFIKIRYFNPKSIISHFFTKCLRKLVKPILYRNFVLFQNLKLVLSIKFLFLFLAFHFELVSFCFCTPQPKVQLPFRFVEFSIFLPLYYGIFLILVCFTPFVAIAFIAYVYYYYCCCYYFLVNTLKKDLLKEVVNIIVRVFIILNLINIKLVVKASLFLLVVYN